MSATLTTPAAAETKNEAQLQAELAAAELTVERLREELHRVQWLREYEETPA